jgi:hypothetical protein
MNLLRDLPDAAAVEIAERLAGAGAVRIERIVSDGQASPAGSGTTRTRRNSSSCSPARRGWRSTTVLP